jgi:hypothetical protein
MVELNATLDVSALEEQSSPFDCRTSPMTFMVFLSVEDRELGVDV